jgi:hypothetical protein
MRIRNCMFMMFVFTSVYSLGQGCQSGDFQQGAITGPYTAAETAENTAPNFPQCVASSCAAGPWNGNQRGFALREASLHFPTGKRFREHSEIHRGNLRCGQCCARSFAGLR